MPYRILPQQIPQERRSEINQKILFAIDTGKDTIPRETIYNCYSGLGGLHSLKQDDFANYRDYSQAKKEFEMGQFFTPHELCRRMVELIAPTPSETVLDMCCGMGNFFNFLPNPFNTYGFDIDPNAVRVARHLYPDAHIDLCDIRQYKSEQSFDVLIGNPPFNLEMEGSPSQFYYLNKAYWMLAPAGLLAVVVPYSFLQDEFWNSSRIKAINDDFSFIGQTRLDPDTFAGVGVQEFETKVMVLMRRSENIAQTPYKADEFVTMEELAVRVQQARKLKQEQRIQLNRENLVENTEEYKTYQYKVKKYLYELKKHPHLQKHYGKALALVTKLRTQKPPDNCSHEEYKEWEKHKLTPAKVLAVLRRYICNQYVVPRKEVALVRTSYGFKLKEYAPRLLDGIDRKYVPLYELIANGSGLPFYGKMTPALHAQYASAMKVIERKRRAYQRQSQVFSKMERNPMLDAYVRGLSFKNKELKTCYFLDLQQRDMGLAYQKDYSLLNWQQGSGKTGVAYHFAKRLLEYTGRVKNVVIVAPAIAIKLTWKPFLTRNEQSYILAHKPQDLEHVPPGVTVIVSLSMLRDLKRSLMQFVKMRSRKICLVFDESDELTNHTAKRTRITLDIFRRVRYKMLTTGTTTRNNINELYSQFELLYNNSANMMCWCRTIYYENKEKEIVSQPNSDYGRPFPARRGAALFKACHCPGKVTVFGVDKQNQDIYNKEELRALIEKTIITRKFREFAGDKYEIVHHTVAPSDGEREVQRIIMEEFFRIVHQYFAKMENARKEAQFNLIRQIQLLIRSCSTPNYMEGYYGDEYPSKVAMIAKKIRRMKKLVAVGCTSREALSMYEDCLRKQFPERPLFVINGDISFERRDKIIDQFEASGNGILVCTQQSLKSSVNIPMCDDVILEALQWNIPRMEQFYFRFIRLDSPGITNVHFVSYEDSIEQNLMQLILTKERLNEFIKSGEVMDQSDIYEEFDISPTIIDSLLHHETDKEGRSYFSWGGQRICA